MYATANVGGKWGTVLPFRAVSSDGKIWDLDNKPLLQVGAKGTFDEDSVETPSVVRFKGKYHLFYTGVVKGLIKQNLSIGHATSDDGINWTRLADEPLLKPTGNMFRDWNGYHVAEPGAVVFNNQLYLYFHASGRRDGGGKPGNQSSIGLVVSSDGYTFSEMRRVLTQGPRYPTTAPAQYVGYSTPNAEVVNGQVHLFYDVIATKPSWQQIAIHHAVSDDGVNFIEDPEPLLERNDLSWTKTEIRAPATLYEDGRFRLWFAGHDVDNLPVSGIGYIDLPLPK
jgi:sucrose-6-phosphate hydrolase SacC (GH32 family)